MKAEILRNTAIAFALVVLSGCASVPMSNLDADQSAKAFNVAPDKANIYLYRNEQLGAAVTMPVMLNGKLMGRTAAKTYFLWQVAPGTHEITSIGEDTSTLKLTTEAGRNYYVWQEMKMGMWQPRSLLQQVPESVGRAGVMESSRAADAP